MSWLLIRRHGTAPNPLCSQSSDRSIAHYIGLEGYLIFSAEG